MLTLAFYPDFLEYLFFLHFLMLYEVYCLTESRGKWHQSSNNNFLIDLSSEINYLQLHYSDYKAFNMVGGLIKFDNFTELTTLVSRLSVQARISVQGGILTKIK